MSWFFSGNNTQQPSADMGVSASAATQSASTATVFSAADSKAEGAGSEFDPTALMRAVETVKVLDSSNFAAQSLAALREKVRARQLEIMDEGQKFEKLITESVNQRRRIESEERQKTAQVEAKQQRALAEYQDRLARERYELQLAEQKRIQEENQRKQEESMLRQEELRRQTIEHEVKAKERSRLKNLEQELRAKAHARRENRDLYLDQIRVQAEQHRQTVLESIRTAGSIIGDGAQALLADPNKIVTALGGLSALALGIYTAKGATTVTARYVESRITKPSLVNETSRLSLFEFFKHPVNTLKRLSSKPEDSLRDIVLEPKLDERLRDIAILTKEIRKRHGTFKNIELYGPPGTGKTLFARKLAEHSGMDYAITTGGKIAPLGNDATTAIHKLFDWSQTSRRGLLLFIDEADAFLRYRSKDNVSENMRAALATFLARASGNTSKFMLVLASNRSAAFDDAIKSRIDIEVEFALPGLEERERLLTQYFQKYVMDYASGRFRVADFDYPAVFKEMAKLTEGMSGRGFAKLGAAWQSSALIADDKILTEELVLNCCVEAVEEHKLKMSWR